MKSYTDLIDQALLLRQSEDKSNYFPLRPSSAGYHACRLAYGLAEYLGMGTFPKEVKEPATIRLLNLGSSVEWHSIKNFDLIPMVDPTVSVKYKQQALSLFRLDPVGDEKVGRLIEGSIDFAVLDNGFLDIGDCKSLKDKFSAVYKTLWDESKAKFSGMKTLQQFGENAWYADDLESFLVELNDPFFANNFYQVNAYCGSDWFTEHNGRNGFVYRYCKNDSRHLEIHFRPSPKLFQELKDKFNNIYRTVIETGNPALVKKECWLGSPVTAFSSCKDTCWKDDALKAYFKTFPKKQWPTDIKDSDLNDLFFEYENLEAAVNERDQIEEEILKILVEQEETKVKTVSGSIYDIKYLKSDKKKPFHLRPGKL